ncbi:LOW QUALITY PROTEIN: protein SFI1 homolog [Xyrichtys novacula]|uniref:LOW QUALITY PROTEIN: protein SFI1 homolog n=1 Tax=Xyrichtys novacula TaxID=13765 RepID=A0AAV1EPZ9_XYRNO|nr:LOW QUALITY PROTEIN: protein SFI1 homolog [Xyrichtys novacula]
MQNNARKPHPVKPRLSSVNNAGGPSSKHVCKPQSRKISYRVGYNWNRGGRLKELRIRHLARKFLKIWIRRTFGRILPHTAKSHYNNVVLRRAFAGWRDEWWTSQREWSLSMRAECHYRYYLCNLVLRHWQIFVSLRREKKSKLQNAQLFADRKRMSLVLDRWEVFVDMKRIKRKMLESALELRRLTTLHSAWRLWQARLQHCKDLYTLESQALKEKELTLQRRAWFQWKEMHTAALCQKEKESKAALHFILCLKRKTLHHWKCVVPCMKKKRESEAAAQRTRHLRLLAMCWSRWKSSLHHKWNEENRLQAAERFAIQSTKRRTLECWKAYVMLCREDADKDRNATQHHCHNLLRAGFMGLSLNVLRKKTHRLNKIMAVQQYHQTMRTKYWRLWQDRLEEAEDKSFKQLAETASTNYSTSLLSRCFQHWRETLAQQRHMQELERHADIWFAERILPQCFDSWAEFTLQRKLSKQRKHEANVFNQQHQYTWVFYTWWGRAEQHKEQKLSERMAFLHHERSHLQRAWSRWRQRTEQRIIEEEKQEASEHLYKHRLLHKTVMQWKDNSTEMRDRRSREQQACRQCNLHCMRRAVEKWKKFVHRQQVKKSKLREMQRFHEVQLLKHTFMAWKKHTLQTSQLYSHAEELYRQQQENLCRKVVCTWRGNAALRAEVRLMKQEAQTRYDHVLQLKVFLAWRGVTQHVMSRHRQQREAVGTVQRSMNEVQLLRSFRHWRKQTRAARRERICMEKARQHHASKLLSTAMKAWNKHHCQCRKNKVVKRQGILLLRLKMYQVYFEQWRVKLQHRQRETQQTERALWHWSLSLQAKVLCGWRLWVTEQHWKREQAAKAAEAYRDQLLKEGVSCILTYAAHMNDLTTNLTQQSQPQRSRRLQRVAKRCALRWKQRALCKPERKQEVKGHPPKKSVSFCLTGLKSVSLFDSEEPEAGELSKLPPNHSHRRQPRRCEELFESPIKTNTHDYSGNSNAKVATKPSKLGPEEHRYTVSSCVHPSIIIPNVPVSGIHVSTADRPQENQDVLLPPSAFMATGTKNMCGKMCSTSSADGPFIPPGEQQSSADPEVHLRTSSGETLEESAADLTSTLTSELSLIQLDMQTYQQDRKQLRAWQKLRQVLQSWLQTSGQDEQMEKRAVCEELKELEERIDHLSTDLERRKTMMKLHAERIQHLRTVLNLSGVPLLHQKPEDTLCLQRDLTCAHTLQN